MAKRIATGGIIQITFGGGGTPAIRAVGYSLDDDSNAEITYKHSGTQPEGAAAPHALTGAELGDGSAGTVQKLVDDIVASINTAESIS
jgi:hypothetical protein